MSYKKEFKFGKLVLPNNIFYAPLAGCSDFPFRKIASRFKPGLLYCEMVKMDALVRYDEDTFHMLDYDATQGPIGAQLCGSKPELAGKSARIIEDLGFDVLDLNCGCPVDKVTKDGSGSGLLKNPRIIGDILANMVAAVSIPVTVKIRAGWDEHSIVCEEITRIAESAGATAITVHARTRAQAYNGPAKWEWITQCKQAAKEIVVIGNGDLHHPSDVAKMHAATGCDAFLVARGTMGQPWFAEDVGFLPDSVERNGIEMMKEHFAEIKAYQSDRQAMIAMRRIGCWYLKNTPNAKEIRHQIAHATSLQEIEDLIELVERQELHEVGARSC